MVKELPIGWEDDEVMQQLKQQARWLSSQELAKAGASALNRAARSARTTGSREVRKRIRVKARAVKKRIEIQKATPANQEAELRFDYEPIPLSEYGAPRQTKKGVTVTIKKGGGRTLIPQAHIEEQWGDEVVIRKKKGIRTGGESKRVGRTPRRTVLGPSIGSQLEKARPAMDRKSKEVMDKRMKHEIEWRVEKANRVNR